MRRLRLFGVCLVLSALVGVGAPVAVPSFSLSAQQKKVDPATITVYVTKTGEKYHRDGCRYLRQSRIPMSLKEAASRYGPCSVCKPPTLN
jgi:cbb3-type cytochrome oxidase cytochrome c subunit